MLSKQKSHRRYDYEINQMFRQRLTHDEFDASSHVSLPDPPDQNKIAIGQTKMMKYARAGRYRCLLSSENIHHLNHSAKGSGSIAQPARMVLDFTWHP